MLQHPERFFDNLRTGLFRPTLSGEEVDGCQAILGAAEGLPRSHVAYMLATAMHETAHTMLPIKEYGGPGYFFRRYDPQGEHPAIAKALGNTRQGDGALYCGRGYVQLTGRANYSRASVDVGVDLVAQPDLAMRPDIAAKIMREGMVEGWFTGKKLHDYLPSPGPAALGAFTAARRIINGQDRAADIAGYAMRFQEALRVGDWA